jgi:hypothetical protein
MVLLEEDDGADESTLKTRYRGEPPETYIPFLVVAELGPQCDTTCHSGWTFCGMIPSSLLLAALPLVGASGASSVLGVPPELLPKYTPTGSTWKCLDGSKVIPWTAVNNDYCDCPDGSDEPG